MPEETKSFDINIYIQPLLKRKLLVIIPTIIFSIGGFFHAKRLPAIYEANCILLVKSSSIVENLLAQRNNTRMDARTILQAVREKMLSWSSVTEIIKELDLTTIKGVKTDEEISLEKAYRLIVQNVGLRTKGNDYISVSHQGTDPVTNFKIVDGLVSNFMETSKNMSRTEADSTLAFMESDLARLKKNLNASEMEFRQFEDQHLEELPGNENSILPKYYNAITELENINNQISATNEKLRYVDSQKKGEKKTITGEIVNIPNPKVNELDQKITDLEIEITMLRAKYFDTHPAIKKRQDELVRLNKLMISESVKVVSEETIINNPRFESIMEKEFALMLELRSLETQKKEITNSIERFKPSLENIPALKQKLFELASKFDVNKRLYEERLLQKSKAELIQKLTSESKNNPFQVVEPARISYEPLKNEKIKILAMGVILGLGMGVGMAFGLDKLSQNFKSFEELQKFIEIPVIGSIPTITLAKQKKVKAIKANI